MDFETCAELDCPVHKRNDMNARDEFGSRKIITYCGEFAVFTWSDLDQAAMSVESRMQLIAVLAKALSEDSDDAISQAIAMTPTTGFTAVYRVNEGALLDNGSYLISQVSHPSDVNVDEHVKIVARLTDVSAL